MGLETYQQKRDFNRTPEPRGTISKTNLNRFVVQEHHASSLHFDFRLEMGGVLKSWSVRKGLSLDPAEKRLAVSTEDHPVEYLKFQGHIPEGNYGAGEHMIWDSGTYELDSGADPLTQLKEGKLRFRLHGKKLRGEFNLIRLHGRDNQWLLIKGNDEYADPGWQLELLMPDAEGKSMIESGKKRDTKPAAHQGVRKIRVKTEGEKVVPAGKAFKEKDLKGDLIVKVGRELVALTHLDKVYWPDDGYTKGDLVKYYYEIGKTILPYLKDRPLIMKRYPNGITEQFFHQHDVNEAPDYARTITLDVVEGHAVNYLVCDNLPTLLYMANLGAIERHTWHSRIRNLNHPDWFVFDLDPGEGVRFKTICKVAVSVRGVLSQLGLEGYAKTSGSRGIHIYVPVKPVYSYEQIADFAEKVAKLVARESPKAATVERSLSKRGRGQIYVDHMQNARGKSVVAPYSVRPKPGATVSAPLEWGEVEEAQFTTKDFTIENMAERLKRKGDLFREVLSNRQNLRAAFAAAEDLLQQPKTRGRSK